MDAPSKRSWSAMGFSHLIIEKCTYLFGFDKLSVVIGLSLVDSPGSCRAELPYQRTPEEKHIQDVQQSVLTCSLSRPCICAQEKSMYSLFKKKSLYVSNRDSQTEIMGVLLTVLAEIPNCWVCKNPFECC